MWSSGPGFFILFFGGTRFYIFGNFPGTTSAGLTQFLKELELDRQTALEAQRIAALRRTDRSRQSLLVSFVIFPASDTRDVAR
jgi:hypothetical protein